ncbi:NucA/NucB deoxyribonuclease domain-containing protein [Streptomyces chartreusis]|uniref:NucA/NucB deoxyribonuclease domain-containing protein n=1 Tax=Streptomyces chartreusis TaxID=1969 RepID=UPI003668D83F
MQECKKVRGDYSGSGLECDEYPFASTKEGPSGHVASRRTQRHRHPGPPRAGGLRRGRLPRRRSDPGRRRDTGGGWQRLPPVPPQLAT